jgi:hypothetical protein
MLSPSHHHHIVARCDALNLVSDLVREPFLQLQAVGDACERATDLADRTEGYLESLPLDQLLALRAQLERGR